MKRLVLGISIIASNLCMASPMSYDLGIYGNQSWASRDAYSEYANSNFWAHHYWNFSTERDECSYRGCLYNPSTHSGVDYQVNTQQNRVLSYSFGKIIALGTRRNNGNLAYGQVSIRNLVNSGEYFQANLLHSSSIDRNIAVNNYISKYQKIGIKNGIGKWGTDVFGDHLHFEIADSVSLSVPNTSRTYPCTVNLNSCRNNNILRQSLYSKGGLIAHYDGNRENTRYYNPREFTREKEELLAFLSRQDNTPSYNNFDIYGISNKTIYGHLNINATGLSKVGILVRDSKSRSDAEHSSASYNAQKFLAESSTDFNGLDGSSDKYIKGDYLFVPYVNQSGHRYGYPIKFSFVDKGSFIIDNDKTTYSNGASYSETLSHTVNSDKNNVPGYFLTSRLIKVTANNYNDFAKWSVPSATDGEYHLYAHIPKGATASDCTYTIRTTDGDKTKPIDQSSMTKEDWADLGTYSLNSDGYVKLSLRNDNNGEWMAFDAIKFEKVSSGISKDNTFNGTGSIVATDQNTIGGNQDIVALQLGNGSMGSFQWYQENGYCPNLLIANRYSNAEVNEVLVVRKSWGSSKISTAFKTTLPFSLSKRDIPNGYDGVYDTILIKSLSSLNKRNQIVAICRNKSTSSSSTTVSKPSFKTKDGYTWAGNGSIISQSLSGIGIGKTEDYAYRYADKKALTIFQWQPSSRCKKLKISASYYDYTKQRFQTGKSFNGKLSTKVWKLDSYIKNKEETSFPYILFGTIGEYYMLEIRTEKTMNSNYKYLYAECRE